MHHLDLHPLHSVRIGRWLSVRLSGRFGLLIQVWGELQLFRRIRTSSGSRTFSAAWPLMHSQEFSNPASCHRFCMCHKTGTFPPGMRCICHLSPMPMAMSLESSQKVFSFVARRPGWELNVGPAGFDIHTCIHVSGLSVLGVGYAKPHFILFVWRRSLGLAKAVSFLYLSLH